MLRLHDEAPGLASAFVAISQALEAARPPQRVLVSECAWRHRRLNNPGSYVGRWRNEMAPHLVEPMDSTVSRAVSTVVFTGPPQTSGKTELILNVVGHAAKYAARDILLFQPTEALAEDFAKRRVKEKMLEISPDLKGELAPARGADNILDKRFRNGALLTIRHPTGAELSSRPVPVVIFDERDTMPDEIGEEGDPVEMGRNRTETFGNNGKIIVVSSLKRRDGSGTLALYYQGDQRLWHFPCPHCDEYFAAGFDDERKPTFAHLHWAGWPSKAIQPGRALETAVLNCPHCHADIEERHKEAMNLRGVWLAKGQTIEADGTIHGDPPATRTRSYWFCGLSSNFVAWGKLAHDLLAAEQKFEADQDETALAAIWNRFGFPYKAKGTGVREVTLDELRARRLGAARIRTVPAGVRFLTAAVDVQGNRFEVGVVGWGAENEAWYVDRFALRTVSGADEIEIRPGEHPEHWGELLERVFRKRYPLADRPGETLGLANVAVDTGGVDGVDVNAKEFWIDARLAGVPDWSITLIKGASRPAAPIWKTPRLETPKTGRERYGSAVPVYDVGVSRLKDVVINRLRRDAVGPGYLHLPDGLEDRHVAELLAERKEGDHWTRRGANETWDLLVYATFAAQRMNPRRVNWDAPPSWARPQGNGTALAATDRAPAGSPLPTSSAGSGVAEAAGARDPAPAADEITASDEGRSAPPGPIDIARVKEAAAAAIAAARRAGAARPMFPPPPELPRRKAAGWRAF